jgi:hypothetical protein
MTKSKGKSQYKVRFASEKELRDELIYVLRSKGHRPVVEIPFLGRSLDVVYQTGNHSVTVIEVKRLPNHIRRALNQAKIALLGADNVYVCTPLHNVSDETRSLFENLGIGLMFICEKNQRVSLKCVFPSRRNGRKQEEYAALLCGTLAGRLRS